MTRSEFKEGVMVNWDVEKESLVDYLINIIWKISKYAKEPEKGKENFTCHNCCIKDNCLYAWDGWNTDGDCLGDK